MYKLIRRVTKYPFSIGLRSLMNFPVKGKTPLLMFKQKKKKKGKNPQTNKKLVTTEEPDCVLGI